jgi:hypothetical protein
VYICLCVSLAPVRPVTFCSCWVLKALSATEVRSVSYDILVINTDTLSKPTKQNDNFLDKGSCDCVQISALSGDISVNETARLLYGQEEV